MSNIRRRPQRRIPNHEYDCATCGNRCHVYRSPKAAIPKFCSYKCRGIAHRLDLNPNYSDGREVLPTGYVLILHPSHPNATTRGYVYEHRLEAERSIGRALLPGEVVHHINHIRADNRPENLRVFSSHSEHMQFHHAERKSS